jgi:hypothetical protein
MMCRNLVMGLNGDDTCNRAMTVKTDTSVSVMYMDVICSRMSGFCEC